MGAYGLTQALLQIPFGRWSDRLGRKPVIVAGLALFAAGSLLGAMAQSLAGLALARSLQGAGAVSAAVSALLADLTRPELRTRAMAFIGISIGLSFVLSLVFGPVLEAAIGVPGIFVAMLVMALAGIALIVFAVPAAPERISGDTPRLSRLHELAVRPALLRLHLGVFAMHFMITAIFLAVPAVLLERLHIATTVHWMVYLSVFVASIVGTVPLVLATERAQRPAVLLVLAILATAISQALLGASNGHFWIVMGALTLFFAAFNYLEARLPALLTLAAPGAERGAALGVFATAQFLGAFAGGALGGVLLGRYGLPGVFWGTAVVASFWAVVAAAGAGAEANAAEHA
jgi:predicted MFS family arabinose efflux permease